MGKHGPWNGETRRVNLDKLMALAKGIAASHSLKTSGSWNVRKVYTEDDAGLFMLFECAARNEDRKAMLMSGHHCCRITLIVLRGAILLNGIEICQSDPSEVFELDECYDLVPLTLSTKVLLVAVSMSCLESEKDFDGDLVCLDSIPGEVVD